MEAKLRYQKELYSSRVKKSSRPVSARKNCDKQENQPINKIDITHSAPKEIPKSYGDPRIDFIQRNINQASNQKSRVKAEKCPNPKERLINQKHYPGEIPSYYAQRASDMKGHTNIPDEDECPPGMKLLTDEEKAETIEDLMEQKLEIESTLGRAPLRIESPLLLRQHKILEQQLQDIEASLEQLKKKYVFVPE